MSRASVVIPNYNGAHLLPACLDSLLAQARPLDEIVVVDDASTDGSRELVQERYPQVKLIVNPTNVGFARSANVGLRNAGGDLLFLLNNDTDLDGRCLAEIVAAADAHPAIGFFAPKMRFADRREWVNSAGLFLRADGVARDIGFRQPDGPEFRQARPVFGASGGAALYRRALLDDVGLFDEDLVAYAEDVDLSFRAQLRGWTCLFVPQAVVYHRHGATYQAESARKVYFSSRNMLTVLLKNMPAALIRRHWPEILAGQLYQVVYYTARGHGWPALHGKIAALRDLSSTLRKRQAIQHVRRASDDYIESILSPSRQHGRFEKAARVPHARLP